MKMTSFVVDANVVFSIILSPQGKNRDLFFYLYTKWVDFSCPEFCKYEVLKYLPKIAHKKEVSYGLLFEQYQEIIKFIKFYTVSYYKDALSKVKLEMEKIDIKDIDYVALAFKLWVPLWTNDKKLHNLKIIKTISTSWLLQQLSI